MEVRAKVEWMFRFTAWNYDDYTYTLAVDLMSTHLDDLREKCIDEFANENHYVDLHCWILERVQVLTYGDETFVLKKSSESLRKAYPYFFDDIFTNHRYLAIVKAKKAEKRAKKEAADKAVRYKEWLELQKEFGKQSPED